MRKQMVQVLKDNSKEQCEQMNDLISTAKLLVGTNAFLVVGFTWDDLDVRELIRLGKGTEWANKIYFSGPTTAMLLGIDKGQLYNMFLVDSKNEYKKIGKPINQDGKDFYNLEAVIVIKKLMEKLKEEELNGAPWGKYEAAYNSVV